LDPGVVLYLMRQKGMEAATIERLLYNECGLKALSGVSNDVRELLASNDEKAAFALDYFVQRIAMAAGSLTAALGGLDAFVFTAGIGENSAEIRRRVIERLSWLGLAIDPARNEMAETYVSQPESKIACLVIPTDEEVMIARHVITCLELA
jgi:acetate kinase